MEGKKKTELPFSDDEFESKWVFTINFNISPCDSVKEKPFQP